MEHDPYYEKYTLEDYESLSFDDQQTVFTDTFFEARIRNNLDAEEQLILLFDVMQNHPSSKRYEFKEELEVDITCLLSDELKEDCAFLRSVKNYLTFRSYFN